MIHDGVRSRDEQSTWRIGFAPLMHATRVPYGTTSGMGSCWFSSGIHFYLGVSGVGRMLWVWRHRVRERQSTHRNESLDGC